MKPLMSVNDVCAYLGVSRGTVYRWVNEGRLPAYRVGERIRFRPEELDERILAQPVTRVRYKRTFTKAAVCPECGRTRCRIRHSPLVPDEPVDDFVIPGT